MKKTPSFQSAPAKINLENVIWKQRFFWIPICYKQRFWDISLLLANCYRAFREFNRLLFCPQEGFYVSKQSIFPSSGIKIYYRNVITKLVFNWCYSYSGRRRSLLRAISSAPFFRGGPRTGAALKYVKRALFKNRSRRRKRVLFVITHGKSFDNVAIPSAILRRGGVQLISIGVGKAVSVTQLRQMVGKRRGAVFTSSFRTLLSIAQPAQIAACRGKSQIHWFL